MSVSLTKTAEVLFKNCPSLVKSEEAINALVMRDVIDFNTGMKLIQNIKSTESDDVKLEDGTSPIPESGIQFPSVDESVVFKTVIELSSDDDNAKLMKILDELNEQFQVAYKKRREEIIRVISNVVEIGGEDVEEATKLADVISKSRLIFIKK